MKPNRFEEMREDMKEQLEREMENKQNETLIFLESKVGSLILDTSKSLITYQISNTLFPTEQKN